MGVSEKVKLSGATGSRLRLQINALRFEEIISKRIGRRNDAIAANLPNSDFAHVWRKHYGLRDADRQ